MRGQSKVIEYQPIDMADFGASIHTTSVAPLLYVMRQPSGNSRHDVVFVSSYLHDATFRVDEIRLHRRTLTIPLVRHRWELYRHFDNLFPISSEVKITKVLSYYLELSDNCCDRKFFRSHPSSEFLGCNSSWSLGKGPKTTN